MKADDIIQWIRERDKAIKSCDINELKAFYKKWLAKGLYDQPLPASDEVIETAMYKMLYNLGTATDAERAKAKKWLNDRGCATTIY